MPDDQHFMTADGTPLPYLQVNDAGSFTIPPDTFSAIRLLLAALDSDDETLFEVMRERPALPLMSGLMSLVIALGDRLYGPRLRDHLDGLALVSDGDAAEEFRQARRSS